LPYLVSIEHLTVEIQIQGQEFQPLHLIIHWLHLLFRCL